jgi:type I restriction enzyme S subunit
MRREAEQKAKEIIPALFLDMFGDPATNPRGWPVKKFRDLGTLDRGRSRHRPRDASHLYGGPHPFVQTGDVTRSGGAITTYTQTYSDAGLAQSKLWPVGTLCITIAANIAETGVLALEACFPDSVVGFLPGASVRTAYIQHWLGFLQPTLAAQAPQAAQKNINLEILRNLNVPVPPMALQDAFESHASLLRSMGDSQKAAITLGDQAFQSLLAGVFGEAG